MWRWHRGCSHGGGLTSDAEVIRPAVEAALDFARYALLKQPSQPPPAGLKKYLGFSKLSPATVRAVARIIDGHEDFRARVAEEVEKDDLGLAGWLWLTRPDGWEEELEVLEAEAAAEASAAAEERSERNARRKLSAAREAAERANATAEKRAAEVKRLRGDLAAERSRRADAEDRMKQLADELEQLRQKQDQAVQDLETLTEELTARTAEAQQAQARLRELEASQEVKEPQQRDDAQERQDGQKAEEAAEEPEASPPQPGGWDREEVVEAVASAAAGASLLGDALDRLGSLLGAESEVAGPARDAPREPIGPVRAMPDPSGRTAEPRGPNRRRRPNKAGRPRRGHPATKPASVDPTTVVPLARRVPVRLPGGVMDDSAEAAAYLLRTHNVLVLIDGYNVTMTGWPELPVADQRARLLKALDAVAAGSGAEIEVIFDGAEVEPASKWPTGPRDVRVRFSPPEVEADDVVLDMLAQLPPARPVVVVSSDNRVRAGAWELGANLLHARQLLEILTG